MSDEYANLTPAMRAINEQFDQLLGESVGDLALGRISGGFDPDELAAAVEAQERVEADEL